MKKSSLIAILVLYIASAAISFGVFKYLGVGSSSSSTVIIPEDPAAPADEGESELAALLHITPGEPKDQPCPLNGQLYTNTEKTAWEKRRPLAVMVENTKDARPQSGMSDADIVYEAIAEGGITRFMGLFYCGVQAYDTTIAPVRSARTYFVDWASGYNRPMYVHVGGANIPGPTDALGQLTQYGWTGQNDMNQFSIGYPTFVRDYNRIPGREIATEHTMVTTTEKLWEVATKRGWTNLSPTVTLRNGRTSGGEDWKAGFKGWTFEDGAAKNPPTASKINYDFWEGYKDFAVEWNYDSATNSYKRSVGGEPQTDLNNDAQIAAKNVVVLFTTEKGPINEAKHMLYTTTGTGDAWIFKNGDVLKVTWSKKDRESELEFLDKGKPVTLNRGLTWISVLAKGTPVTY